MRQRINNPSLVSVFVSFFLRCNYSPYGPYAICIYIYKMKIGWEKPTKIRPKGTGKRQTSYKHTNMTIVYNTMFICCRKHIEQLQFYWMLCSLAVLHFCQITLTHTLYGQYGIECHLLDLTSLPHHSLSLYFSMRSSHCILFSFFLLKCRHHSSSYICQRQRIRCFTRFQRNRLSNGKLCIQSTHLRTLLFSSIFFSALFCFTNFI